jgi:hypothetical protein
MPVISNAPISQTAPLKKMKVSDIIEIANQRTERRGEKTLNLKAELLGVLQEFCQEHRWYWRRKSCVINTVAATYQYDLTEQGVANVTDFEQVSQAGVKLFDASGNVLGKLTPVFDIDQQEIYAESQDSGQPTVYWISENSTLNLYPNPNDVFRVRIPYWATPGMDPDSLPEEVPLVPPNLYRILIKGLEAQILRYTLGEGAAKYEAARTEYEKLVTKAAMKVNFAPGEFTEWRNNDSTDAVQSS